MKQINFSLKLNTMVQSEIFDRFGNKIMVLIIDSMNIKVIDLKRYKHEV